MMALAAADLCVAANATRGPQVLRCQRNNEVNTKFVICVIGTSALWTVAASPSHAITNATPTTAFAAVSNGVQVAPDWVFTATHALLGPGATYSNGFGSRTVAAVYAAPGSTGFPGNDFSLMRLLPATTAAPLLPVNGTPVAFGTFPAWDVTIASGANSGPARGYGWSNVNESLQTYIDDSTTPPKPYTVNWLTNTDTSVHVQGGDSGGGLFAGHVADSGVLIGITSALLEDNDKRPTGSAFVQPASYRSWIDATLLADLTDNQAVRWTTITLPTPVPEPGSAALWAVGVLTALAWARRRA
jgi:Trypsin